MKWKNTLVAYEEDIKSRTWIDWMKAHTTGFKPIRPSDNKEVELGRARDSPFHFGVIAHT